MSDTTEQECACCGFDTDCIDGLCQPCNDFNYKLEKLHKKVVVELQAKNKDLQRRLLSHISGESVKHTCQDCLRSFWNVDDEIIKCPFCDSEKMPFTQEPIQAKNERLKEAIRNVPLGEYTEALHDGCDANGAFDCLCEAIQNWETEALKG